jgi:hypothetical protein
MLKGVRDGHQCRLGLRRWGTIEDVPHESDEEGGSAIQIKHPVARHGFDSEPQASFSSKEIVKR